MCTAPGCAWHAKALSTTPAGNRTGSRLTRASGCSCPGAPLQMDGRDLEMELRGSPRPPGFRDDNGDDSGWRLPLAMNLRTRTRTRPRSFRNRRLPPLTRSWSRTLTMHRRGPLRGDRAELHRARLRHRLLQDLPRRHDPGLCLPGPHLCRRLRLGRTSETRYRPPVARPPGSRGWGLSAG